MELAKFAGPGDLSWFVLTVGDTINATHCREGIPGAIGGYDCTLRQSGENWAVTDGRLADSPGFQSQAKVSIERDKVYTMIFESDLANFPVVGENQRVVAE